MTPNTYIYSLETLFPNSTLISKCLLTLPCACQISISRLTSETVPKPKTNNAWSSLYHPVSSPVHGSSILPLLNSKTLTSSLTVLPHIESISKSWWFYHQNKSRIQLLFTASTANSLVQATISWGSTASCLNHHDNSMTVTLVCLPPDSRPSLELNTAARVNFCKHKVNPVLLCSKFSTGSPFHLQHRSQGQTMSCSGQEYCTSGVP